MTFEHIRSFLPATRDITRFMTLRSGAAQDDTVVGDLLVKAFVDTNRRKMPDIISDEERIHELRSVEERRSNGTVYLLELGHKLVGTFALIREGQLSQSWLPRSTNLRCVAIDPDYHGFDLSVQLVLHAISISKQWAAQCVCLHVQNGAHGVAKLYQRFGFVHDHSGDIKNEKLDVKGYFLMLTPALT